MSATMQEKNNAVSVEDPISIVRGINQVDNGLEKNYITRIRTSSSTSTNSLTTSMHISKKPNDMMESHENGKARPTSENSICTNGTELFSLKYSPDSNSDESGEEQHVIDENITVASKQNMIRSKSASEFIESRYQTNNINNIHNTNFTKLTPSQRYRLRKTNTQSQIRQKIHSNSVSYNPTIPETEDGHSTIMDGDNSHQSTHIPSINDGLLWNIPMASASTNSFINSNMKKSKRKLTSTRPATYDGFSLPPTSIPGVGAGANQSDAEFMQNTSSFLSSIYNETEQELSHKCMTEREESAECLSFEWKRLSESGLEDLRLVSKDKIAMTSRGRPSWLPPKDTCERIKDELAIRETMTSASDLQLAKSKDHIERLQCNEKNCDQIATLLERGINRNSSIVSFKKIIWTTAIPNKLRNQIYSQLLHDESEPGVERYVESFENLLNIVNKSNFPKFKEYEISKLIDDNIKVSIENKTLEKDLSLLLKLKSISQYGLLPGDELLFYHLLYLNQDEVYECDVNNLIKVWDIVNMIQLICFNEVVNEKYDSKIIDKNGMVAYFMKDSHDFEQEFNRECLNINTWWNIMSRVEHGLFMWILDIIMIHNLGIRMRNSNFLDFGIYKEKPKEEEDWEKYRDKKLASNYKILMSMTLNVLLNYHFGFNDLKELHAIEDDNLLIPLPLSFMDTKAEQDEMNYTFIKKWAHYYKKF